MKRHSIRPPHALLPALPLLAVLAACSTAPPPAAQNPSPMVERSRAHARLDTAPPAGDQFTVEGVLSRPITIFVPPQAKGSPEATLLVHFNGAPYPAMHAAAAQTRPLVLASVHLGSGSAVYGRAFANAETLGRIRQAIADSLTARRRSPVRLPTIVLSAFSAGYGAIRAILGDSAEDTTITGVLLLDGLHVSYMPERTPLASGGALDTTGLVPFLEYARRALRGERRMLVTHSEIFPGTFASTTETADYLLEKLDLPRTPVLEWGPGGMQLLSRAGRARFLLLGFAGNTAPDHVDHYHGMGAFLSILLALP
jgi:hypothetical protein